MKIAGELLATTGGVLPLKFLVKNKGVKEIEKPKFYQGLLLRGKHKSDWARERGAPVEYESSDIHTPPLLQAAHNGEIGSVEWLLSDTPGRLYRQFAENNSLDKGVVALNKSSAGFGGVIDEWLESRRKFESLQQSRNNVYTKQVTLLFTQQSYRLRCTRRSQKKKRVQ